MTTEEIREKCFHIRNPDGSQPYIARGEDVWLYETAKSLPDGSHWMEIGCLSGFSTTITALGLWPNKRLIVIDVVPEYIQHAIRSVRGTDPRLLEIIRWKHADAHQLKALEDYWLFPPLDAVFIDGNHAYSDVSQDFSSVEPILKIGAMVMLHDVHPTSFPGVWKFWMELVQKLDNPQLHQSIGYGRFKPTE